MSLHVRHDGKFLRNQKKNLSDIGTTTKKGIIYININKIIFVLPMDTNRKSSFRHDNLARPQVVQENVIY